MGRARRLRYRHLRRTTIAVLAVTAAAVLVVVGLQQLLATGPVQRLAIRWAERLADRSGVSLDVGTLSWEALPPRMVLRDVTVAAPPVRASVRRAEIELLDVRLTRRLVRLGTVAASGVHLRLDDELEPPRPRERPVRLDLRQLSLRDVTVEGLQLPGSLTIDADGLEGGWTGDDGRRSGFARAERIRLSIGRLEPIEVSARTRLVLEDGRVALPSFAVSGTGVELRGSGAVDGGRLTLDAGGEVDLAELDRVVRTDGLLTGGIAVTADLDTGRDPLLELGIRSDRLRVADFALGAVRGTMAVAADRLEGRLERAVLDGGVVEGDYRLGSLRAPYPHRVGFRGTAVPLTAVLEAIGVPSAGLAAWSELEGTLEWNGGRLADGRGEASAMLRPAPGRLPVEGRLDVTLAPAGLVFDADALRIGRSTVRWQGPLAIGSWEPGWSIAAAPVVLEEALPLVNRWIGDEVLPEEVGGRGELLVTLGGPWNRLLVNARLEAAPLTYPPMTLDRVLADVVVTDSRLELGTVRYRIGDGGGEVDGVVRWDGDAELDLEIRGQSIPLGEVAGWLGTGLAVTGNAAFAGGLRGPVASPRGSWALGLDGLTVAGVAVGSGDATVDLADGRFHARGIGFASGLQGDAWWHVGASEVGGSLRWETMPVRPLAPQLAAAFGERADVTADLVWPLDGHPEGTVRARTDALDGSLRSSAGGLDAEVRLGDELKAEVALRRNADGGLTGPGRVDLRSAGRLAARLLPPEVELPLEGTGTAELSVDWPPGGAPRVDGRLTALDLELDRRPVTLVRPAAFSAEPAGLELDGVLLSLLGDEMFVRFAVGSDGTLEGNAAGTIDGLLLRFLLPGWEPAGRATGVVELLGSVDEPRLEGIAEVAQMSFRLPGTRTVLSGVAGTVLLSSTEAVLEGVDFRLMRGAGRGFGRIERRPEGLVLDLEGSVEGLQYPLFSGLEPRLSGSWRLAGPAEDLLLAGDLEVDRAVLRRKDDVASILLDWFGGPDAPPGGDGLRLDLRVEADRTIEARNPFLQVEASAALDIEGTTSDPGLVGTVELHEGGEITFQNVRYEIARGTVTFTDPLTVEPRIDLELRAWVQNYQVTVLLTGSPDRLVPSLSSDPPLSQTEIYGLLALGVRDEAVAGGALPVGFASTLLTRELNTELERRTRLVLPVDQIRLDPFAETSTGNPAARVTVVKQINPRWTVILQSNLSANREEVIVSRWFLGTGLFLEATRDVDGSYAVDLKLRRRY